MFLDLEGIRKTAAGKSGLHTAVILADRQNLQVTGVTVLAIFLKMLRPFYITEQNLYIFFRHVYHTQI